MIIQINITGNTYFQVQKPDLTFIYTLSRQFHLNDVGQVVTAEGYILQPPITVPAPFNEPLFISEQGIVSVLHSGIITLIGQLDVAGFEHADMLEDLGNGYYGETDESGEVSLGKAGAEPFEDVKIYAIVEGGSHERAIAVLHIDKLRKISLFIAKMRNISLNIANHPDLYISPQPSIITFNTNIDALEVAEAVASTHVTGSAAMRDKKYDTVLDNVHTLQNYIQILADNAEDFITAIILINNAGFEVKTTGVHTKDILEAKQGEPSGTIDLTAKAIEGAVAYEWQMSINGTIWSSLPGTIKTQTSVKGLTVGSIVYFRVRAIKDEGVQSWSQVVSAVVV